jgi:threonyl-tRNA synthetase
MVSCNRRFTQDDVAIFLACPEQLMRLCGVLDLTEKILRRFGFEKFDVSAFDSPEKAGHGPIWETATTALEGASYRAGTTLWTKVVVHSRPQD